MLRSLVLLFCAVSLATSAGGKVGYVSAVAAGNTVVAQLPVDAPTGAATLIVTVGNAPSAPFSLTLDPYAPAFFISPGLHLRVAKPPAGGHKEK